MFSTKGDNLEFRMDEFEKTSEVDAHTTSQEITGAPDAPVAIVTIATTTSMVRTVNPTEAGIPEEFDTEWFDPEDVPDYMIAELSDEDQAEVMPADGEIIVLSTPVAIAPSGHTVVERSEIDVEGMTYVARNNRLYIDEVKGDRSVPHLVSSLIVVVAIARDSNSSSWGKVVRFEDMDGNRKELYLSNQDIITNGSAVIKKLTEEGLNVSPRRGMMDALQYYLNYAPPLEAERAICTDRIGWHDNVYLFPDNSVIGSSDTKVVYTGAPIGNHRTVKGTLEGWRENVAALCRGNSLLILAVCVSFASVLLRLLKVESGGYHIFGESSTGKSTALYVAASIHGDPDPQIIPWRATTNGAEGRAKQCNDSLMILDELHQSNPKEAGQAAYMLMNDKGKVRSNVLGDAKPTAAWRLNCLSSGEVSFAAFIQSGGTSARAGQAVRMLDISADMGVGLGSFENIHGAKDSHAFAEHFKVITSEYYGTPIRVFLEKLIGNNEQLYQNVAVIKESFFARFVPEESDGQVKRVATKMAIAALAGEIATAMGITGWRPNEAYVSVGVSFTKWLNSRGTTGQQEAEKAVEQVRDFLLRHGMSRFAPVTEDSGHFTQEQPDRQCHNMAGFRITKADSAYEFIVFPEPFKNEMCQGLNLHYVIRTLVERGFLMVEPDGKAQVRRRLPGMSQSRVYHIKPTILSDTDEFAPAEYEAEE
jgi:uncharacterized protein (DUF927 family)